MKILSTAHGDALLTNAEVMKWLRDIKIDAPESEHEADGRVPPPENAREIGKEVLEYFARCPSANQTTDSVKKLYEQLEKHELSDPELVMIANIRPEAYNQLTPLIVDAHNRFSPDTIWEILEAVKTLEPAPKNEQLSNEDEQADGDEEPHDDGANEQEQQTDEQAPDDDEMDTTEGASGKHEVLKEELKIDN